MVISSGGYITGVGGSNIDAALLRKWCLVMEKVGSRVQSDIACLLPCESENLSIKAPTDPIKPMLPS